MFERVLFYLYLLLGLSFFTSASGNPISSQWSFIEIEHIPEFQALETDAFLTKSIKYRNGPNTVSGYILMEGWENGWTYSHTSNGTDWKEINSLSEPMDSNFVFGDFVSDGHLDLLLFLALEEENHTGDVIPEIPRLYKGSSTGFTQIALSCNPTLQSYFLSKLDVFIRQNAENPNLSIAETYKDELLTRCKKPS